MPSGENQKPNQPLVVSKGELSANFRILSPEEVAALDKGSKKRETRPKDSGLRIEQAETIMEQDFFGPTDVEAVFGVHLEARDIPSIPFSEAELERAKELDQFLVLRVNQTPDGQPLTMIKMHEILTERFTREGRGKVLHDTTSMWKVRSEFFMIETPELTWALSGKTLVPGSIRKNYVEQTKDLADYVTREVFKDQDLPRIYQAALTEFQEYMERNFKGKNKYQIEQKIRENQSQKYGQELGDLAINQMTRQSPADALYDMLAIYLKTETKIFENAYTWTKHCVSDDGRLVYVGIGVDGVYVFKYTPDNYAEDLGVAFSRSL